jgi:DNA-directed RNA polymerase subunit H (RpoH/RPB5)
MEELFHELRGDPNLSFEYVNISEKNDIVHLLRLLRENDENRILIIRGNKQKFLPEMIKITEKKDYSRFFFLSEIELCPVKHDLVPKHRLATEEEIEILKKRKIPLSSLPKIKREDVIIRWYGWKQGIVAIEREEGTYFRKIN